MISEQEIKSLNDNADRYVVALGLIETAYKKKKINKKQKKEIERRIKFIFSRNYWKLNPFIKDNKLLYKMSISTLERYNLA